MENLLDIRSRVEFDETIAHSEIQSYSSFASSTYNKSDDIHIVIQHQDQCHLPSQSWLHIIGKFLQNNGEEVLDGTSLTKLAILFLFQKIRYLLFGVEIDESKNVGLTSIMKAYASLSPNQLQFLEIAG